MIEVHENLFIGNEKDFENDVKQKDGWAVVQACKEPYHREAIGYSGRSVSPEHEEYLVARRGNRLILNMVDVENPNFFDEEMIEEALDFVDQQLDKGNKVLIHCNQGKSRSPSLGLLFLATRTDVLPDKAFSQAEEKFKGIYPYYDPKSGIRGHLQEKWDYYKQ